jgi:hypothetical protein
MAPILGIWASSITASVLDPGAFVPIATTTVPSGGAASVTFSSIPSTYTHLQIRGIARSTGAGQNMLVQLNSDTGSNYAFHNLYGDGSSAASTANTTQVSGYAGYVPATSSTANAFGGFVFDVLDYANTNKYKTIRSLNGTDLNGSGLMVFTSGLWMNTAATTTLTFYMNSGNLAQYSSFTLYGIKG